MTHPKPFDDMLIAAVKRLRRWRHEDNRATLSEEVNVEVTDTHDGCAKKAVEGVTAAVMHIRHARVPRILCLRSF